MSYIANGKLVEHGKFSISLEAKDYDEYLSLIKQYKAEGWLHDYEYSGSSQKHGGVYFNPKTKNRMWIFVRYGNI